LMGRAKRSTVFPFLIGMILRLVAQRSDAESSSLKVIGLFGRLLINTAASHNGITCKSRLAVAAWKTAVLISSRPNKPITFFKPTSSLINI
jgi:hypothetical protein